MLCLVAQDLIERAASAPPKRPPTREFSIPMFVEEGTTHKAPLPKDVGGLSFDPRELILAIFEQETNDKILNEIIMTAEKELVSNALTLMCQASPTLCNTIKHVRANANSMMQAIQQQLAVLESKLPGLTRIIKAEIIHGCFEEKLKKGVPVPVALRECLSARKLKSVGGKIMEELDLAKEISALFGLSREDEDFLSRLLRHVKITPDGVEVELAKPRLDKHYWRLREKYYDRWRRAFEGLREGRVDAFMTDGPVPKTFLSREEISRVSLLPDWQRERIVSMTSGAMAYYELHQQVTRIDRYLAATSQAQGASEGIRQAAQMEREEILREMKRLEIENQRRLELQDAMLMAQDEADAHVSFVIQCRLNSLKTQREAEEFDVRSKPWGSCCEKEKK
jgi:hypothetical protein